MLTDDDIRDVLADLAARSGIPGASCAIRHRDAHAEVVVGWADPEARWPVTPGTTFQIGSITKMVTAMLVLFCRDRGLVALDDRLADVVPELRYAVDEAFPEITVTDLLQHTSGMEGQFWTDLGRGDEARRHTVRAVSDLPLIHRPGEVFSYTNNGYVLAGHLVERLLGQSWEDAAGQEIRARLGVDSLSLLPEEALLTPVARGHLAMVEGKAVPALRWQPARGFASGGGISVSARDLATIAQAYLGGEGLLSAETVELMRTSVVDVPGWKFHGWGLGHALYPTEDGRRLIGHDGQSPGHTAALRMVPSEELTIAVCCNAQWGSGFATAAVDALVDAACGVRRAPPPAPGGTSGAERGAARFRRLNCISDVEWDGDRLRITRTESASDRFAFFGIRDSAPPPPPVELYAVSPTDYVNTDGVEAHFSKFDAAGDPQWIHDGFRLATRVA